MEDQSNQRSHSDIATYQMIMKTQIFHITEDNKTWRTFSVKNSSEAGSHVIKQKQKGEINK